MRRLLETAMRQYGTAMTVNREGECFPVRAFLQPSRSKAKQEGQRSFSPLGEIDGGQYVYIGPAEPAVQVGDVLTLDACLYRLCRVEKVYSDSGILYLWGLCRKKGGDDTWGCQA